LDLPSALLAAGLVGIGYVSGSIPMGVIVSRLAGGRDPRSVGSGRIGGTNIVRTLGFGAGVGVGLLDIVKGAVPVLVAREVLGSGNATVGPLVPYAPLVEALTGFAAVVGSHWSLFLGLHGGRGVAAGIGAMLVLDWRVIAVAAPVFLFAVLATRYVSLGSLLGTVAGVVSLVVFVLAGGTNPAFLVYGVTAGGVIWLAHSDNIDRLLHGTERRFSFSRDPGA
jgi:glycerol-3-phosphate acyltransferase PlsY